MIENDQIRAINIKVLLTKSLLNNTELDVELIKSYLLLENIVGNFEQLDAFFKFVTNTLTDNNIKEYNATKNFNNIFKALCPELEDQVILFFENFLSFYINDNDSLDIDERLNALLEINCDFVPDTSEVKRLYLYLALILALAQTPLNMKLVDELNTKLQNTL